MMKFITENFKWITLVIILLIGSNLLTNIRINRLSKKEKRELQYKYDSLNKAFKAQEIIHLVEKIKQREIFLKDSLVTVDLRKLHIKDSVSSMKQTLLLAKFKKLNSHQTLTKLDSAYEADSHP